MRAPSVNKRHQQQSQGRSQTRWLPEEARVRATPTIVTRTSADRPRTTGARRPRGQQSGCVRAGFAAASSPKAVRSGTTSDPVRHPGGSPIPAHRFTSSWTPIIKHHGRTARAHAPETPARAASKRKGTNIRLKAQRNPTAARDQELCSKSPRAPSAPASEVNPNRPSRPVTAATTDSIDPTHPTPRRDSGSIDTVPQHPHSFPIQQALTAHTFQRGAPPWSRLRSPRASAAGQAPEPGPSPAAEKYKVGLGGGAASRSRRLSFAHPRLFNSQTAPPARGPAPGTPGPERRPAPAALPRRRAPPPPAPCQVSHQIGARPVRSCSSRSTTVSHACMLAIRRAYRFPYEATRTDRRFIHRDELRPPTHLPLGRAIPDRCDPSEGTANRAPADQLVASTRSSGPSSSHHGA